MSRKCNQWNVPPVRIPATIVPAPEKKMFSSRIMIPMLRSTLQMDFSCISITILFFSINLITNLHSQLFPLINYGKLVEHVKVCQINANSSENDSCVCELCRLGAANAVNVKVESSEFLIGIRNTKVGKPSAPKQVKITDLVPDENKTKDEKLNEIVETSSPNSLEQICIKIMKKKVNQLIIYF